LSKSRRQKTASPAPKPAVAPGFLKVHGWRILPLWILVAIAYSNSFQAGLVFDNAAIIGQDARIRAVTAGNLSQILHGDYWNTNQTSGLYRPVTTLSYLMNYAVLDNGTRPTGYHWINLALHAMNVAFAYGLGVIVLGDAWLAFALAALWGAHPLLTESVTNIVGRADLLATFGVLAGLLCYLMSRSAIGTRKWAWLAALAVAQTIGLFSKESGAVLPGIMLLYDLAWPSRATWRDRIPAYSVLTLPFVLFAYLRSGLPARMHVVFSENPLIGADFWTARLTAVKVIGKFLWLFLWPAHLSADYSYNAIPLATGAGSLAILLMLVCAIALVIRWRAANPPLFFFVGFFFVALLPASNLIVIIGSIMGERFMYLPSLGLAGCVIIAIRYLATKTPRAAGIAMAVVCVAGAARAYVRNFDWRDERSLWASAVAVVPESARAHNNLGNALLGEPGMLTEAIAEFKAALRIRPGYAEAHYNLGKTFALMNHLPEAIAEYQDALQNPSDYSNSQHDANVHISLGNVLARLPGRLTEAIAEYRVAIRIQPQRADAHYNLGNALAKSSLEDAITEWSAAVRIDPDLADAHYNLGIALASLPGRRADAIAELEAGLRSRPDAAHRMMLDRLKAAGQ
jgi:tetratricopeptide (TPR) repeat protein